MSAVWVPTTDQIAELEADWRSAEEQIKEAEQETGDFPIPPVNELRYAGRHLLDAFTADSDEARQKEFSKAQRHTLRAKYDAAEVRILSHLRSIMFFRDDYRTVEIAPILPDWQATLLLVREVQDRIRENRRDDRLEKRGSDHGLFVEYSARLKEHVLRLDVAREELNKKLELRRENTRRWAIGISVAIVLALLAALTKWIAG